MNAYIGNRGHFAEDLINTHDLYLSEPEHLRKPEDLKQFLAARGITTQLVTEANLIEVRGLRDQLRAIWTAASLDDAIRRLNPLLNETPVSVQAAAQSDQQVELALHAPEDASLLTMLTLHSALGIVEILQEHGLERMRACAAEPCRDVFIDTSRNRSRRFCSERCANRYNIAAFRERQRD